MGNGKSSKRWCTTNICEEVPWPIYDKWYCSYVLGMTCCSESGEDVIHFLTVHHSEPCSSGSCRIPFSLTSNLLVCPPPHHNQRATISVTMIYKIASSYNELPNFHHWQWATTVPSMTMSYHSAFNDNELPRAGNLLIWFPSESLVFCQKMSQWAIH